ncbi:TPA: hypothetical protein HA274_01430 [Candidatus Bathyarchaeota archaeon]|nr:hypothetical protein [Candidatus Bathyarchaeota archaeon]
MVNIVEEWKEMEEYASKACHSTARAYQTIENGDKTTVRVQVGRFGFEKQFLDVNDTLLREIQAYCSSGKFLNVSKTVPDDQFFK